MELSPKGYALIFGVLHLLYLFIGLSSPNLIQQTIFYLLLYDGAILGGFMIFGLDFVEKYKLNKGYLAGLLIGVVIAEILVLIELGFYGVFSYTIPYPFKEAIRGYFYLIIVAFVIGNSEEVFFRGFLPAIVEKYGKDERDIKVGKYILAPAIFGISHYFAWANSVYNDIFTTIYVFMYHFTFGVAMQFLTDTYDSLYPAIICHTVYDATKMIMMV